ncbi:sensor histidine kinase [Mucilaginibacter limnophilus]|uniref:histidine kinase n=1 Tax=Mucilaginibacter limnophilus TaxID=1932778 RepID=A0A3S3TJX8_9SPHI|nr:tetratricopeptide repeat-containing sensor histidine kinase [Mucilaginibacter limnophilus]RVU02758.1 sensor histidine kinase [Mucilaginibacter limnophilus]
MKRFPLLIIILTIAYINLFAKDQDPEIENLKRETLPALEKPLKSTDTLTVNRLNQLAQLYFESYPDSTIFYAKLAVNRSKKIGYSKGAAEAYIQIATVNSFTNDYTAAYENFNQSLQLYRKLNDSLGISEVYMGLGQVEDHQGKYDKALRYFNRAIAIRKALYEDVYEAESYAIMGVTYDNKGEFSKALDCYFRSLNINLKYNNQLDAADNYNNIGIVLRHLKLYPKALEYFNKALNIWFRLKDKQGISSAYQNIGEVLTEREDYSNAISYLQKASAIFHDINDQEGISAIYYDLGMYQYHTNRIDSALHYLNLSLQSAKKNNQSRNQASAYYGLAMLYNRSGKYKQAHNYALNAKNLADNIGSRDLRAEAVLQLSYALGGLKQYDKALQQHRQYVALTDSLQNNESIQKLISYNLAIDFENSQKQASLKEATLKKRITRQRQTILIAGVVILVITTLLIVYYNAKRKQSIANKLLEQKNREILAHQAGIEEQSEKLNQLNTLKDRLIGILAHDLRAPISTLRNMFVLLTDKDISQEEFIEMVPRVNEKLENTSGFLDTLLVWINSQVDNAESKSKKFVLHEIVQNEVAYLNDQLLHKKIHIHNNVSERYAAVADPNCIRIVIHNLLTNAIKFSEIGGVIELYAEAGNDDTITLRVKDNGVGLPEEKLNRLFKGTVASNPGTLNETGTGMGLVFCKDLIEKFGGKIWAENNAAKGTTFSFKLPVG